MPGTEYTMVNLYAISLPVWITYIIHPYYLIPENFHHIPPKLCAHEESLPIPSIFFSSLKPLICFLCFLDLSILDILCCGIIQYVAYCVWLNFTYSVFKVNLCCWFLWLYNSPLHWSTLWPYTFNFLQYMPSSRTAGPMVTPCLTFYGLSSFFWKQLYHFTFPETMRKGSSFSSLINSCYCLSFFLLCP